MQDSLFGETVQVEKMILCEYGKTDYNARVDQKMGADLLAFLTFSSVNRTALTLPMEIVRSMIKSERLLSGEAVSRILASCVQLETTALSC